MNFENRVARSVLQLSSGTISVLIREEWDKQMVYGHQDNGKRLGINPILGATYYAIDRVRWAFAVFCETRNVDCAWGDAWKQWIDTMHKVRWSCGYMGATYYNVVPGHQGEIVCKHSTSAYEKSIANYTSDEFDEKVAATVGCVHGRYGGPITPAVACLFPMYQPVVFSKETDWKPVPLEGWEEFKPETQELRGGIDLVHGHWDYGVEDRDEFLEMWEMWKVQAHRRFGKTHDRYGRQIVEEAVHEVA